jgi:hypothetical protein
LYVFVCQGLILSKALKAQKDAEDESTRIAFGNLRSEVITLRNGALEKDKILVSLVERLKSSEAKLASLSKVEQKMEKFEKKKEVDAKCIADLEYALSIQVELHRSEVQRLEKKLDEITENFNVEQEKHEISDIERLRVQKNVEELHQAKEECYNFAMECCKKLKNSFAKVGTFSTEQNFIRGDPDRVIKWIGGKAEAFDEILSDRGDFCASIGARGAVSLLEKASCEHAKAVIQLEFSVSAKDIKDPSAKVIALSRKFYSEASLNGGREVADATIRQNEEEFHTALEEVRKAEEAIAHERLIGIFVVI